MRKIFTATVTALFISLVLCGCVPHGGAATESQNGAENESTNRFAETVENSVQELPVSEPKVEENTNETSAPPPVEEEPAETNPAPKEPETITYVRSTVDGLNVRSGAGTGYKALGALDKGDMLLYLGEEGGWRRTYYRGKTAYVSAAYTEKYTAAKSDDRIESIILEGCRLLGTPYVYGATRLHDGSGHKLSGFKETEFDCSSLMQYIFYYGADINLQVNTRTQVYQGIEVKKEDIARGDLLFFTNASRYGKKGVERIGHVALYLGDGYILHTASDHAVIEKISAKRDSYFVCARRVTDGPVLRDSV